MRIVPMRHRFGVAVASARTLTPLLRHLPPFRERRQWLIDSDAETTLSFALTMLNRAGVRYLPRLRFRRFEILADAVETGRGVLLVGPHSMLSLLVIQQLGELGYAPAAVSCMPANDLASRPSMEVVKTGRGALLDSSRRLRRGELVCAMLDRPAPNERPVEIVTDRGTLIASDALVRIAVGARARIVFGISRLDADGTVVGSYFAPAPTSHSAAEVWQDFVRVVQDHVRASGDADVATETSPVYRQPCEQASGE
jgi:lauroyl/myristoyl acyltransferase